MIKALFGPSSMAYTLRRGLNASMAKHREVAQKVANSLASSTQTPQDGSAPGEARRGDEDLVQDMSVLADTQIRYEAEARLLRAAYERLRTSIRSHG